MGKIIISAEDISIASNPSPSKVLLGVDLDGEIKKKDSSGNISQAGLLQVIKITKNYTDWQGDASSDRTVSIGTFPAGATIVKGKLKHSQSFLGGSTTAVKIKTFINSQGIDLGHPSTGFDLFQAIGDSIGCQTGSVSGASGVFISNHSTTSDITAELITTNDIIDNLTQGSVDIWIWYVLGI